jgi:hypothetical protein
VPAIRIKKPVTGESCNALERACYAVLAHGDGTGTIVLNWYETSIGCDFMHSETFMRTNINTARAIVLLLNQQLPNRVQARTEYEESPDQDANAGVNRHRRWKSTQHLSNRIHDRLVFLLGEETKEAQHGIVNDMEQELERLGEWVSRGDMTPKDYCTQVFLMCPAYISPLLETALAADFNPDCNDNARDLIEALLALIPSGTYPR